MKFRLRMIIARIIDNHNENACWTDLVVWANGSILFNEIDFTGKCKRPPDFDEKCGGCYCLKHKIKDGGMNI